MLHFLNVVSRKAAINLHLCGFKKDLEVVPGYIGVCCAHSIETYKILGLDRSGFV
jgi:hypothetical protein